MITNRLDRLYFKYQSEFESKALEVLRSGHYILGPEVKAFEAEFASYIGTQYCVGLANGLDALWITFRVLGIKPGDEVIVQANTYIASVMGITMNGATPILVEPDIDHNIDIQKIESLITPNTKAILVVHLYGLATRMESIQSLCMKHKLYLVEDCAQSHGATYNGQMTGTFGDCGCFSFYPSKNIGAFGDGGAITTNDPVLAEKIRVFRNYGSEKRYHNQIVGTNSRLDELQAGLLRVKLNHVEEMTKERIRIANRYLKEINNPLIKLPIVTEGCGHVWHLFVVRCQKRDLLLEFLKAKDILPLIHYPIPPHLSEAYAHLECHSGDYPITERLANEVLSIPLFNGMTEQEVSQVINAVNAFTGESI